LLTLWVDESKVGFPFEEIAERVNSAYKPTYKPSRNRGVKAKLMIAQTLIDEPSLLLLEDPLAGLKGSEAKGMAELLLKFNEEGVTIVCAGGSVDGLAFCDRIVVLKGGVVERTMEA
jgi:ABC-type Na+ transport system ATPase subunit NatA